MYITSFYIKYSFFKHDGVALEMSHARLFGATKAAASTSAEVN